MFIQIISKTKSVCKLNMMNLPQLNASLRAMQLEILQSLTYFLTNPLSNFSLCFNIFNYYFP